jgi:polyphosphate kinase
MRFLAIFSSNLDEFFKVRVSDIRKIEKLDKPLRKKLITKPNKLLKEIKHQVDIQQNEFGRIFYTEIIPDLKKEGVHIISHKDFTIQQQEFAVSYYNEKIKPSISLIVETDKPFLENEKLYLVSQLNNDGLLWVKIESDIPRFVTLPKTNDRFTIVFVDDILKFNLKQRYEVDFYAVKISRDAELYIDNEYSGNLLNKIIKALPKRDSGQVTRVLIDELTPKIITEKIKKVLDINETDLVYGGAYHNFKDFFAFPYPKNDPLSFTKLPAIKNKELAKFSNIFEAIRKKDRLLCFPYESFNDVTRLITEASVDKDVTSISITLYRISKDSKVAQALLSATKQGKTVAVFIETKARFDEENNIKWGKKLESVGARVIYSYPGIKVHSKILLIERVESGVTNKYGYISTGNFNEKTSKIYTDFGLMTANSKITNELCHVFQVLEGRIIIPKTKSLLVSPFTSRNKLSELIKTEIKNAQNGHEAYIILKLNSLQDTKMINLLYEASNAGVTMRLLIRGICCLVPGIKNQSENIQITSIVDRFLEHGRVFIFANNCEEKMYIGSADWMTRNLDHRIEVITPILDKDIHKKIRGLLDLQLNDNVKARLIDRSQNNNYMNPNNKKESSQELIYKAQL